MKHCRTLNGAIIRDKNVPDNQILMLKRNKSSISCMECARKGDYMRYETPNVEVIWFGQKRSDIITTSPDYEDGLIGGDGDGDSGDMY